MVFEKNAKSAVEYKRPPVPALPRRIESVQGKDLKNESTESDKKWSTQDRWFNDPNYIPYNVPEWFSAPMHVTHLSSFDFRDAAPQRNYNFSIFSTFFGYHSATPKSSFPRICNIVRRYLGIRNDTSSKQMVAYSAFSISLSRPTNALSGNLENGP